MQVLLHGATSRIVDRRLLRRLLRCWKDGLDEHIYHGPICSGGGWILAVAAQKEFHVVIEKGEDDYYVASVVELPGCHTQAKDLKELDERVREVITLYLEAEGEKLRIPEFIALKKVTI